MSSSGDSMAQADDKGASGDTSVPRDTGTLGKLMVLLDLVTHADAPLRFTDILALANQPRGTLHRQLGHLVEEGLLEFDAEGRYAPGLRLLDFASRSWARNEFRLIAAPHLAALEQVQDAPIGVYRDEQPEDVANRVRLLEPLGQRNPDSRAERTAVGCPPVAPVQALEHDHRDGRPGRHGD